MAKQVLMKQQNISLSWQ